MTIMKVLNILMYALPGLIRILTHYKELSESPDLKPEDREEAKALLESLKWKDWEDI